MEVKELMLGNYLHEEGVGVIIVESLNSYGGEEINEDSATGYIEAIPLTDEWLLKFGFELENLSIGDRKVYLIKDTGFRIDLTTLLALNDEHMAISDLKMQYVHQLQNLYFAITGDELTIR